MIRRHAFGFRLALMVADGILAALIVIGVSIVRFGPDWFGWWSQIVPEPISFFVLWGVGWVLCLALNGLYRPRARWSLRSEIVDVVRATLLMGLLVLSFLFLFRMPDVSRVVLFASFPLLAVATIVSRGVLRSVFERRRRRGQNLRYVLVIGAGPRGQAFATKLEAHRELGLRIAGFLDDDASFPLRSPWLRLGALDDIERIFHEQVIDEVAICLPFSQWSRIDEIGQVCEAEGKIVRIPIDVMSRTISTGRIEELDGTPVYSMVSGPDRVMGLFVKRLIDVVASGVGLILLSPFLAGIAVAIVLDDGRPVLFRQTRVGLHGRSFRVLKFRSMHRDAEARIAELEAQNEIRGRAFKVTNDPRVTRVGRFLRRSSLDELPQLWNVLRGEMSLVGPRPPLPSEVAGYDIWHRRRLSMKPGITGLWQVRGRRDPDFDNWVASDLEYIDRWSLMLDFKILARTIPAALEGR
jgi:exopolysaccharide biosynthesis polyprenyl glycosylphosphotransferase